VVSTLRELLSLSEAKKQFDHDECVKFVEGWVSMGDAEEMAEEGATLAQIMKQFWGDVDDDSDRRAEAKKIGLTKALAREIMSNVLDNHDIELGRGRTDEDAPKSNRMYGMDAPTDREKLISQIEGHTGTLDSMPYDKISTDDLKKILKALKEDLAEGAKTHSAVIVGSEDRKDGTYIKIVEVGASYHVPRERVGGSQKVGSLGVLRWSDKKDSRGWHFDPTLKEEHEDHVFDAVYDKAWLNNAPSAKMNKAMKIKGIPKVVATALAARLSHSELNELLEILGIMKAPKAE